MCGFCTRERTTHTLGCTRSMHGKFSVRVRPEYIPSSSVDVYRRCARAARELCKRCISVALPYLNHRHTTAHWMRVCVCYTCARAACIASCCVVRLSESAANETDCARRVSFLPLVLFVAVRSVASDEPSRRSCPLHICTFEPMPHIQC